MNPVYSEEIYNYPTDYLTSIGLKRPIKNFHNDVLFNILLNSDMDTIKNLCINKNALMICNDSYFWQEKFNIYHIPIMSKTLPTTMNEWIKEYEKVSNAHKEAINIYAINNIEAIRPLNTTDGMINISITTKINPRLILDERFGNWIVTVVLLAKNNNMIPFNQSIELKRITNDKYTFKYILKSRIDRRITTMNEIDCTKEEIIKMLIQLLYHNTTQTPITINDGHDIPFTEFELNKFNMYNHTNIRGNKRLAIIDTINYLK